MCFINRFNLLNTNQVGFLAGKNTSDAPTKFLDKALFAVYQNRVLVEVFLDFSNSFDTFDHEIFQKKLYYHGFRGKSLDWFSFF